MEGEYINRSRITRANGKIHTTFQRRSAIVIIIIVVTFI